MGVNQGRLGVGGEELTGRDVVEEKVKDSKKLRATGLEGRVNMT